MVTAQQLHEIARNFNSLIVIKRWQWHNNFMRLLAILIPLSLSKDGNSTYAIDDGVVVNISNVRTRIGKIAKQIMATLTFIHLIKHTMYKT